MKLKETIQQPEGRRLEFKEKLPTVSDLCKTIVAFSNDAGGELYIGVKNEPRELVGVPEEEIFQLEEQISNLIYDNCYPIVVPEISVVTVDEMYVLKVQIYKGSNVPYYIKNKGKKEGSYIRIGSTNRLASEEIIADLERQKRNISFDSEIVFDQEWNALNYSFFAQLFEEKTEEKLDVIALKKLHLIKEFQEIFKPTNALILLSDDTIKETLFPYAKIECARFKGVSTDVFIDQKTISGSIVKQTEEAYDFVLRHINKGATINGVYTKSHWEYPIKAIREAVRNAVIHRDYSLSGKDIKIAIYDDMVEITSPGKLLPSVDFNELDARQSDIRNKIIAPVFKKIGIIDQWGNGLKLISTELKNYPDIEFKWFEKGLQFQIQFVHKGYLVPQETEQTLLHSILDDDDKVNKLILDVTTKSRLSRDQVVTMFTSCQTPLTRKEILELIGYKNHSDNYKKYVEIFIKEGFISYLYPETPNSSKQKYVLSPNGVLLLNILQK